MSSSTDGLMKLHPVTFIYKSDPQGVKQYGLVAEEVEQVYPELVVHDEAGKIESVRYLMLTSMLLNELQKQHSELWEQRKINECQAAELKASNQREKAMRIAFGERLSRLEQTIIAEHEGVKVQAAFNR
jgi:aspartokinase